MLKTIFHFMTIFATIFFLSASTLFANTTQTKVFGHMYRVNGTDVEKRYNDFVTQQLPKIGYHLTDPHRRVNDVYKKLYGSTKLDILSFLPVTNDSVLKPLFNLDPRLAGFNPFNMLIYKKLDDKNYHIGHLSPKVILDIVGITDPLIRDEYTKSFVELDALMDKTFGKKNAYIMPYATLPKKKMMNFVIDIDPDEDIEDYVDTFQEDFEEKFAINKYVIAGFHNFMDDEEEEKVLTNYDAFWTYALCHMKYSSTVFDGDKGRPDAGIVAPCTVYMCIPKGSHKLYIGMPRLENVKSALKINDEKRVAFIEKLEKEIPKIFQEMGAKVIDDTNPLVLVNRVSKSTTPKENKKVVASAKEIDITDKKLATMFLLKGNVEEKYNKFVEKTINKLGFKLTDPHKRVNDVYKKKYGKTNLDILSFMSIANEKVIKPLFDIDPRIAGFNPFNFLIYKKLDENTTHIGHLRANAILDMLSITDEKVRKVYTQSLAKLDELVRKELGGKEVILEAKGYAKDRMMTFQVPFKREGDIDDIIDEFQENFEGAFENKKYIIAGFNNFKEGEEGGTLDKFDAFWTYSLCHFKYSYTIFDNKGSHPEGGLFAPCTMYLYIKKGDNKIVVGMPKLANWKATLGLNDKVRSDFVAKLDREIPEIMHSLGAEDIENTNPMLAIIPKKSQTKKVSKPIETKPKKVEKPAVVKAPVVQTKPAKTVSKPEQKSKKAQPKEESGYKIKLPTPPKPVQPLQVITVGGSDIHYTTRSKDKNRGIVFSERRPPSDIDTSDNSQNNDKNSLPGESVNGRVSTYLHTSFMDLAKVKEALKNGGFTVLSSTVVNKKGTLTTVTFTNDDLKALAQKPNSGFTAVMRVLINKVDNEIAVTNPVYFSKAYLGENYDKKIVKKIIISLNKTFKDLKNSEDKIKFSLLPNYRFMEGMPYYKDMVEVAKGKSSKALLEKLKSKAKFLKFAYKISDDTYLVGVGLGKRTSKFIKKTGSHNAFLLPYPILIEKGVAKIMEPKYYISLNYPNLKMSNFMKIATIPDAIINDCQKLFK